MDNLKNKAIILEDIGSRISKIAETFNGQANSCFNSSYRSDLFEKHNYNNLYYFDEFKFTNLFSTESFKNFDTSNIVLDLEKLCFGYENIKKATLTYLTEMRIIIEQKCREHKNTLLKSFFILPSNDVGHIKNILIEINRTYENFLYQVTIECNNTIKMLNKDYVIHIPRFSDDVTNVLEAYFNENNRPDKELIARQTGLSENQVDIWFNNRRSRSEKDDVDYEKLTNDFLEKKVDWTEKFAEIDSDSLTSKDMIQIIVHAFNLRCTEEEETSQATDDTIEESPSEIVKVSIPRPTRSRAKAVRNSVAPYSKNRPNKCTNAQSDSIVINEISEDIQVNSDNSENLGNLESSTIEVEPENSIILRNYEKRRPRNHCLAARNAATPYTKSHRNRITVASFSKDQIIFSEVSKLRQFSVEMEPLQTVSPNENETQNRTSTNFSNTSQYFNTDFSPHNFMPSENTTLANEFAFTNIQDFSYNNDFEFMANTASNEESFDYNRFSIIE
ncbi:hypothetical protein Glove_701g16 [Diversispora epigaea]|uniref:Homeobox domain-containing protein n=1 Tax=Diversispora epigaea TaxID=1348612 RepID=A0A397G6J4_9GLOM|nr:hypothetical protein Glove_701g16 [Diversispora epigaea]